jgi:putative DNA primase/helicase
MVSAAPPVKATKLSDLLTTFQSNMYPALTQDLADSLGVTPDSIKKLGIGFFPAAQCWIFPERSPDGKVIGLLRRFMNGKKYLIDGGKRGLTFCPEDFSQVTSDHQDRSHFIRVGDAGVPCPICNRENDGCMVSDENPEDPACVICVRTPEGAEYCLESGAGYFHRRKPQTNSAYPSNVSDSPILITEGGSDWLTATDLGYHTIASPSALGGSPMLLKLLTGRNANILLIGDTDAVGRAGTEDKFENLKSVVKSIVKVFPPAPHKDLRAWSPTRAEFDSWVAKTGDQTSSSALLPCSTPLDLIDYWLKTQINSAGQRLLWLVNDTYYLWQKNHYEIVPKGQIRSWMYSFFGDKKIETPAPGNGVRIQKVKLDRHSVSDFDDALQGRCYKNVAPGVTEPFPLSERRLPIDLTRSIIFANGIYDLVTGNLSSLTPDVFVSSTLPYDFNPKAICPIFRDATDQIFNGDNESTALLLEWFGYNMIASNHMQSMMFFFGEPGGGKSTLAGVLHDLLGSDRCCGASTDNFTTLFGKEDLLNKYTAIMAETRGTKRDDIDKLLQMWKAITGGDVLSVPRKYRAAVNARLFCRLTYVANQVIPFDDAAHAMAERSNLLYFPNNFRKKNPDRILDVKLRAETPGIALLAIEGLKQLLVNDRFTIPKVSEEHLNDAAVVSDPFGVFLTECTEASPTLEVFTEYLYDLWVAWSKRTGHYVLGGMSDTKFGIQLKRHIPIVRRERVMVNRRQQYKYYGIGILPGVMEHYCLPMTYNMQTQGGNTNV